IRGSLEPMFKEERRDHTAARGEQSNHWRASLVEAPERRGCVPAPRKREEHARGEVKIAVDAGERGGQNDEIHDAGSRWNFRGLEDPNERTLAKAHLIPGDHAHYDRKTADIEDAEPREGPTHSARQGGGRIFGFAGSDGDNFDAQITEHGHGDAQTHAALAVGQASTMS